MIPVLENEPKTHCELMAGPEVIEPPAEKLMGLAKLVQ